MDALEGLTVLDFTSHIAGPYTTKLLADLGARVIKVERPGGDCARALGPWLADTPGIERSGTYQFLNTNKESIVIDLERPEAAGIIERLVAMADLVVSAFPPLVAERLGVTHARVAAAKEVPFLWMTNFGSSGPYRDYRLSDTVLYAMGGEMFSHGTADREPLKLGGTAALLQCGAMGAVAALGAVTAYETSGCGQLVELSLFETQINSVDRRSSAILGWRFSGRINARPPAAGGGIASGVFMCADGHVEVTASPGPYWERFVRMIDDPVLLEPRWQSPAVQMDPHAKEEADAIIIPWMLSHTRREVWAAARRQHAIVSPVFTGKDLFDDPVFRERGLWTDVEHAALGRFPMLGRPYMFEKTPWRIRRAAPVLGGDTRSVLIDAGYDGPGIDALYVSRAVA